MVRRERERRQRGDGVKTREDIEMRERERGETHEKKKEERVRGTEKGREEKRETEDRGWKKEFTRGRGATQMFYLVTTRGGV